MSDDARHATLVDAIEKLSHLTGEDFHGYRSEVWGVLSLVFAAGQQSRTPGPVTAKTWRVGYEAKIGPVSWPFLFDEETARNIVAMLTPLGFIPHMKQAAPAQNEAPANRGEAGSNDA